jgi:O-antigen/teichoic acid export membrane protein
MMTSIAALLAGTRVLTHMMSTGEYGRLALAVSLATLAVQIFGEPIGKTAVRFYVHWQAAGMPCGFLQWLSASFLKATAWIFLLGFAGIAVHFFLPGFSGMEYGMLTCVFAVFLVFNRVALALEDAARKRRFRGMMQGGFEAGRFLLAVTLMVLLAAPNASTVLAGFVLAAALAAGGHILYFKRLLGPVRDGGASGLERRVHEMDTRAMQAFQLPLIVSNGGIWVVMMADRWVLTGFGGSGDVGGYSAVYQLAFIPMLVAGNFLILFLEPILYQVTGIYKHNTSALQVLRVNHYAALCIAMVSFIGAIVLFFGHSMLGRIFLGADFRAYSWLFPWLILAGGCFAASQQLLLKLSCDMRTGLLAKVWGGTALVALTAYTVGAMFWQMKGVLAAVVGVNLCLLLFSLGIVIKKNSNEVVTGSKK